MGRKKSNIFNQTTAEAKVTTKEEINKEPIHIDLTPEKEIEPIMEEPIIEEPIIEEVIVEEAPKQDEIPVGDYEDVEEEKVVVQKLSIAQKRMRLRYGMKRQ